ncbi:MULTISPECIES: VOC family protein [unclassified Kitasatospora]|uniref:VOC family protein n=1 Tax=unclassified Kitasatospora TaxID=2633591 RepID=UPI00070EADBB|nr:MULTISPECIES: VOC family protein [unclassified Kitasatospora]KQV04742.1 hydroxylase [Kitasatospora sp. Root107]KRB60733.1 hydroxylase [Kitasatospora sp. Root187]
MRITESTPGAPCWAEHCSGDAKVAQAFYGELFGWRAETDPRPEAGGYTVMLLGEDPVAAITPLAGTGRPTAWTVAIATADADTTAATATAAGGAVPMAPTDVFDEGRYAMLADPAGAVFSVWQARAFRGAALLGEPGALGWIELATRDVPGALAFYPELFGWSVSPGESYTQWGLGGRDFGGVLDMGEQFPADLPPYWMPYFAVADVDLSAERAVALGAEAMLPPTDVPDGPRLAVLRDPLGAVFGIYLADTSG